MNLIFALPERNNLHYHFAQHEKTQTYHVVSSIFKSDEKVLKLFVFTARYDKIIIYTDLIRANISLTGGYYL